jgi:group II intron reverse transcriptase/maturase
MEPLERKMNERPSSKSVSTKLQRIAELARQMPGTALTTLSHHIDLEFLEEAYRRVRKDGAVGVDEVTAEEFARNLEENLKTLLDGYKSGNYKAPPVRRVYIPKDNNKVRPIGIPTFGDKVLQKAVAMVLNAIYEEEFLDCSYGFRPGRNQHQALQVLWEALSQGDGFVLEMDISSYFDSIPFVQLRQMLDRRVRDGVMRKMIDKWLKAGVMEGNQEKHMEAGTPQGGVASPILANIYLHEVLDKWFEIEVRPRLAGRGKLIRFADDAVIVFSNEDEARRVKEALEKRMAEYGLKLHPEKTRIIEFRRPRRKPGNGRRDPKEHHSFDFLGFTHYWGRGRKGYWIVKRKTAKGRLKKAFRRIFEWCRGHRHMRVKEQCEALNSKLRGHYNYYGITNNFQSLSKFFHEVKRIWRYWLNRRSQKKRMPWSRFNLLLQQHTLRKPCIVHSVYGRAANP